MSRETFKQRVMAEAQADLELWGERPMSLVLDMPTTLRLVGALQLALRHPAFKNSPGGKSVREFVQAVEGQIPEQMTGLHQLIRLGYEQEFDA
jgi:hypothetical protein